MPYICIKCGGNVETKTFEQGNVSGLRKCQWCGYKLVMKVHPQVVRKIKAGYYTHVNNSSDFQRDVKHLLKQTQQVINSEREKRNKDYQALNEKLEKERKKIREISE